MHAPSEIRPPGLQWIRKRIPHDTPYASFYDQTHSTITVIDTKKYLKGSRPDGKTGSAVNLLDCEGREPTAAPTNDMLTRPAPSLSPPPNGQGTRHDTRQAFPSRPKMHGAGWSSVIRRRWALMDAVKENTHRHTQEKKNSSAGHTRRTSLRLHDGPHRQKQGAWTPPRNERNSQATNDQSPGLKNAFHEPAAWPGCSRRGPPRRARYSPGSLAGPHPPLTPPAPSLHPLWHS